MLTYQNTAYFKVGELDVVRIDGVSHIDVEKIFDCGQSFRFDRVLSSAHAVEFSGCAHSRYVSFAQDGDTVYVYNSTPEDYENIWKRFLGLGRDYAEIDRSILSLSDNPSLKAALECSHGIRILSQEPWEAICSFIISQNNNIPRIKKLVCALSRAAGDEIDVSMMGGHISEAHLDSDGNFYSFPSPDAVAALGIPALAELKTGFRAKYIHCAAQSVSLGELDVNALYGMSTKDAAAQLCRIKGIGPKVASCALLFGFEKLDAFPVDVWIKRVIAKYFGGTLDPASLGPYAGIAQQYLFYYERYLQSKEEQ